MSMKVGANSNGIFRLVQFNTTILNNYARPIAAFRSHTSHGLNLSLKYDKDINIAINFSL